MSPQERDSIFGQIDGMFTPEEQEASHGFSFSVPLICLVRISQPFEGQALMGYAVNKIAETLGTEFPKAEERRQQANSDYGESLSRQIFQKIRGAQLGAEQDLVHRTDNQYEFRFERARASCLVELSFREVGIIGELNLVEVNRLIENESQLASGQTVDLGTSLAVGFGRAVEIAKAFLEINKRFVRAGGKDDQELRGNYEDIVNKYFKYDINPLTDQTNPWDPDYFKKE